MPVQWDACGAAYAGLVPRTCGDLPRLTDPFGDGFGVLEGREVVGMSNWWCGLSVLIPGHDASAVGRVGIIVRRL